MAFIIPLFYFLNIEVENRKYEVDFLAFFWALCLVFFLNYRFLVTKFLLSKTKSVVKYAVINIILVTLLSIMVYCVERYVRNAEMMNYYAHTGLSQEQMPHPPFHHDNDIICELQPPPPHLHKNRPLFNKMFFTSKVLPLIFIVGMSLGTKTIIEVKRREKEIQRLKEEYNLAVLENLHNQFSPHFIFNTLNNIYALVGISPQKAQAAILQLSDIMRSVTFDLKDIRLVPLSRSIKILNEYISVMSLRVSETLNLSVRFPEFTDKYYVAPFVFVSLVENAFKHGVMPMQNSFIHISMDIVEDKYIELKIENSCFDKKRGNEDSTNTGISNLRKRLDIVYADEYDLELREENGKFISRLKIPIREEEKVI